MRTEIQKGGKLRSGARRWPDCFVFVLGKSSAMSRIETKFNGTVKWLDIKNPSHKEMEELSVEYKLNELTVIDCMQPEHLPKYEFVDGVHFLILRFYSHTPDRRVASIQETTNKIAIFYSDDFLITIHKLDTPFLDLIKSKTDLKTTITHTTGLVAQIVWYSLETYDNPADRLSEKIDFYERQIMLRHSGNDHIEALYTLKREASLGLKVLTLMQEPINHIYIKKGEEAALQDVRDQHLKMLILYGRVLDDAHNLLNLSMSFSTQKTNEVMKVLTVFSVFFMPLTFIAGIYGMNFKFMPELDTKWGYPVVLLLMGFITVIILIWFKRKKWL